MFSFTKPTIESNGNKITISGINGNKLVAIIHKQWGTSRIKNYLVSDAGWRRITFFSFFALDFYHLLETIIERRPYGADIKECEEIQLLLKKHTWLASLDAPTKKRFDRNRLKDFVYKPLPHQEEVFEYYETVPQKLNLKGALINAAPGTGKTYTSLAIAQMLDVDTVVVICPNNAVTRVWEASIAPGKESLYRVENPVWTSHQNRQYNNEKFLVFHYEALGHALDMVREIKKRGRGIVILDENHNLNEINSNRTLRFIALCEMLNFDDVIFMSGTPLKAMSNELIPFFRVCDPTFTEHVEARFRNLFKGNATSNSATDLLTRRLDYASFYVDKSATNVAEPIEETIKIKIPNGEYYTLTSIAEQMAEYIENQREFYEEMMPEAEKLFYRCVESARDYEIATHPNRKEQNAINLDYDTYLSNVDTVIKAYHKRQLMSVNEQMAACTRFEKTRIMPTLSSELKKEFAQVKSIVKYVDLKIRGECLGRVVGGARINAHVDIARHIDYRAIINSTKKKTLIFSSYNDVCQEVVEQTTSLKYKPLGVFGDTTKDLSSIVNRFATDKDANPLVATYASLSTAVPLVMADTMIIINPPFRDYVMKQTIARVARIGQTTQTKIYHIMLDTDEVANISTRNIDIMEWSREQVNDILGLGNYVESGEDEGDIPSDVVVMGLAQEALIAEKLSYFRDAKPTIESRGNPLLGW